VIDQYDQQRDSFEEVDAQIALSELGERWLGRHGARAFPPMDDAQAARAESPRDSAQVGIIS
jgi:hypothetical protein